MSDCPSGERTRTISVVIPFFNEADAVRQVITECIDALESVATGFEIVCVDDCSSDPTPSLIEAIVVRDGRVRLIRHSRNFGQAAALWSGIRASVGEVLVTMDGDGQNVPHDLQNMLSLLETSDMVVGIRSSRQDSILRIALSRISNAVRRRVLRDGVRDSGCALRVFRRETVAAFLPLRSLYSFIPALVANAGFSVKEMVVAHRPRTGGRSSYGLFKFGIAPVIDMLALAWILRRSLPLSQRARENCRLDPESEKAGSRGRSGPNL